MKLKIKVKRINKNLQLPKIIDKGDWIDLKCAETVTMSGPVYKPAKKVTKSDKTVIYREVVFDSALINLGIAMKLPKGFEAVALPRSSTFKNFGITLTNSEGVIDNSYCGNNDEWKFNALAFRNTTINEGTRIAQFRIQLSQKATVWQKIKWLLSSGIKIVEVDHLNDENRGGIGSTGIN